MRLISNKNIPNFHSEVSGFIGATFEPSPKADFVIPNAVNTNTDDDLDIINTTELKSFTTRFGNVDTISGVKFVENVLTDNIQYGSGENESPEVDSIRNFWGFESSEVNGSDSLIGLDVSNGIDNAISVDAFFGTTLNQEVPGQDNEIFMVEAFGDDSIVVFPLDEEGNRIRDFKLEINTGQGNSLFDTQGNFVSNIKDIGDWGDTGTDLAASIDFTSGSILDDINIVGVAFDLSDFQGTGILTDVAGVRVQGTGVNSGLGSVDLAVIGYNTLAADLEPTFCT